MTNFFIVVFNLITVLATVAWFYVGGIALVMGLTDSPGSFFSLSKLAVILAFLLILLFLLFTIHRSWKKGPLKNRLFWAILPTGLLALSFGPGQFNRFIAVKQSERLIAKMPRLFTNPTNGLPEDFLTLDPVDQTLVHIQMNKFGDLTFQKVGIVHGDVLETGYDANDYWRVRGANNSEGKSMFEVYTIQFKPEMKAEKIKIDSAELLKHFP